MNSSTKGVPAPPALATAQKLPTASSVESNISGVSTGVSSDCQLTKNASLIKQSIVTSVITHASLPQDVTLDERDQCDLEMLLIGALAPLGGYLNADDFESVVRQGRLADGTLWPMPIVLPIKLPTITSQENQALPAVKGQHIKLRNNQNSVLADLTVEDCYIPNLEAFMIGVLGTSDGNHPYVKYLSKAHKGCAYVGGLVTVGTHSMMHFDFRELRKTPAQVRRELKAQNFTSVVGFQTRNPMHKSHYYLTLAALQQVQTALGEPISQPGTNEDSFDEKTSKVHLLITPACGPTQPGDIPYQVRARCYKSLLPHYKAAGYSASIVLLPLAMRMAGPREAVWHALIRRNYGCTHFIVGRDHAGPSTRRSTDSSPFYGPYQAHELLKSLEHELQIIPVFGRNMVFVKQHQTQKTGSRGEEEEEASGQFIPEDMACSFPKSDILQISGSQLRAHLEKAQPIPPWFSFDSVLKELQRSYQKKSRRGFCVYFTGLPCSGKSTLALALEAALQERGEETRKVTVLDADIIRLHLSKGLGFSRSDRQCNVRRIGYVASVVVRHGGICIVANIAPYEEDRAFNRKLVTDNGSPDSYIEVYVSTPLEICEQRDVKEFYKKARAGEIQHFTGISDPYEVPSNPELIVDSSDDIAGKVEYVKKHLLDLGWIE